MSRLSVSLLSDVWPRHHTNVAPSAARTRESPNTIDTHDNTDPTTSEKRHLKLPRDAPNPEDLERGQNEERNSNRVTWDGADDPENPRNWSPFRRWAITFVTSGFSFISPLSSSMISPALPAMSKDLGIQNGTIELMTVSIFVLAFAVGPLFWGPLSEVYGRRFVLQASNILFVIFNTACGVCRTATQMILFRFLAGLGGSATLAIGGGVLSDIWTADERGKAIGIYTLMPLLGPAVGPIAAGFIVRYSHWRWCFFSVSIGDALVQACATVFLAETYPRAILHQKAERLRAETGNENFRTEWEALNLSLSQTLWTALKRPIKLITTQPIVQFCAVYMAFIYGLIYLVLSTFPRLWADKYHEEVHIGGLNYISAGLGFFLGAQSNARIQDRVYSALKARNDGVGKAEYRVLLMIPASILIPTGIFIYAWTAEAVTFWLWPNIGIFILSGGMILCFQCMQIYLVETYTTYAASALAAATLLRSLAGFGFPLFATQLQGSLGYGWGHSVLGFAACGIGWPAVFILWKYGEVLRGRSPFAAGGD